jgi:hypothetical protein
MSFERRVSTLEVPIRFLLPRGLRLVRKGYRFEPPIRFLSERLLLIEVKIVDRYLPDRMLLLSMNILDKHVPSKAIDVVFEEVEKRVPPKVVSSLITAADELVPDSAASSRRFSTVVAGVGKYVPDRIIPEDSQDSWSKLKLKFHIATLLSTGQANPPKK